MFGQIFRVLDRSDHPFNGEKGCEVGSVRGDDDEGEEPPDPTHDPGGGCLRIESGSLNGNIVRLGYDRSG